MARVSEAAVADKSSDTLNDTPTLAVFKPKRTPRKSTRKQRPEDRGPWLHPSGRWCRKIGKRFFYFGRDETKAYEEWDRVKKFLLAGQEPPPRPTVEGEQPEGQPGNPTLRALCNAFDESKVRAVASGELSPRTLANYRASTDALISFFGKYRLAGNVTAKDFEDFRASLAKGRNVVSLRGHVLNVRMVFKHGFDMGLLAHPARFGQGFKIPDKAVLRHSRQAAGKRMFEAKELKTIIDAAPQPLRAMILFGANCGFGATDCASLPKSAVDLKAGWIDFPRPKTAVERCCPLWPETVAALREAIDKRPDPRDTADSGLVFLTRCGQRWVRIGKDGGPIDAVACEFSKLLTALKLKRERVNFYALRHTVQTIGEGARDLPAVRSIMGHVDSSMSAAYREHIADERLQAVVDHVRVALPAKETVTVERR